MRISDWSSDVCSSDLSCPGHRPRAAAGPPVRGAAWRRADGAEPAGPRHRGDGAAAGLPPAAAECGYCQDMTTMTDQTPRLHCEINPVTPFQQNCSLIWCPETMKGALVDAGGEPDRLLEEIGRAHV